MGAANDSSEGVSLHYVKACMHHSGKMEWRVETDSAVIAGSSPNSAVGYQDMMKCLMKCEGEPAAYTRHHRGPWQRVEYAK